MKSTLICGFIALIAFCMVTPSLEARSRSFFSFNVGPVFSPGYVVQPPAYIQDRVYVDPWGCAYAQPVVIQPAPVYYAPPAPAFNFGFGWMFR